MKEYKYLCGNAFKSICKYSSGYYTSARQHFFNFAIKEEIDNNLVFLKTEYLPTFFKYIHLDFDFTLVTHNSDIPIDAELMQYIANPQVKKWYGQNISIRHPKLHSIPIGLANPKWGHGNVELFDEAISNEYWKNKNNLVYSNFDVGTNPPERVKCLEHTKIKPDERIPFPEYLKKMGESYFVISPNGNGVDCHKHWEALYLKTIPIVTKSVNMEFYKDLPFLVIDDWSYFDVNKLSKELYDEIWGDFDPNSLNFTNYLKNTELNG